jgi:alpha-tubulin suppressor-like RCC1 family protein
MMLDGTTLVLDSNSIVYSDADGKPKYGKLENGYMAYVDGEFKMIPLFGDNAKEERVRLLPEYESSVWNTGMAMITTKNRVLVAGDGYGYVTKNTNVSGGWQEKRVENLSSDITKLIYTYASMWILTDDKKCYRLGYNGQGQLGTGDTKNSYDIFKELVIPDETIIDITVHGTGTTSQSVFALTLSGKVFASGYGANYILGNNATANINTFVEIFNKTNDSIKAIKLAKASISGIGSMGIITDEPIDNYYTFGKNTNGSCGQGNTAAVKTPTKVVLGMQVTDAKFACYDASVEHSTIIANGKALFSGENSLYICGDGKNTQYTTYTDNITAKTNFVKNINFTGQKYGHRFVLDAENDVYATGYNATGNLGVNNTSTQTTLIKVKGAFEGDVKKVMTTVIYNTLASYILTNSGHVYRAGSITAGQAGTLDTVDTKNFVKLNIENIVDMTITKNSSGSTVFLLDSFGTMHMFAGNNYGQSSMPKLTTVVYVPTAVYPN